MSILCLLFGHQTPMESPKGWFSPGQEYARIKSHHTDGIGRIHAEVESECPRCHEKIKLCRVHVVLPDSKKEEIASRAAKRLASDSAHIPLIRDIILEEMK